MTYDVAVLVEKTLDPLDADQLTSLHVGVDDEVVYHLLRPVDAASAALAVSLGRMGVDGPGPIPGTLDSDTEVQVEGQLRREAQDSLDASVQLVTERGQQATGALTELDAVEALQALVASTGAAEAIILTEPHVVKEFLHVDWTSRARRHLDVPTLHLLEHVPFAGQGQG